MYFALIRFEPFNAGARVMGRVKVRVPADLWLLLPPTVRTMSGPETFRPGDRQSPEKPRRWSDAMGGDGWSL